MNSGCAILAIGPRTQAGISYLKENDAAVCVDSVQEVYTAVSRLIDEPELIRAYAGKARALGIKNHLRVNIEKQIRQDFSDTLSENFQNTQKEKLSRG